MIRKRKLTSIEAVDPDTGKVLTWTHADGQMLRAIALEGLTVTKINGRPVSKAVKKSLEGPGCCDCGRGERGMYSFHIDGGLLHICTSCAFERAEKDIRENGR